MQIQANTHRNQTARLQESQTNKAKLSNSDLPRTGHSSSGLSNLFDAGQDALRTFQHQASAQQPNNQDGPEALLQSQMATLAQDKAGFHATMQQVYGENYNVAEAESLREQALDGNFNWLPDVRYVDADVLGGANGAYDAESQTVLLNADLEGTELGAQTFVEEAGHHLDTVLNSSDTAGDEGEMFRRVLGGEELSESQVQDIQNEDDTGTIVVDGKEITVEFWSIKKAWKKYVEEPFKEHILEPAKEHIIEPAKKHIVEPFKKYVVKPLKSSIKDSIAIVKDLASFALEMPGKVLMGTGKVVKGLFEGGLKGGWDALRTEAKDIFSFVGHQISDTFLMALHSVVNTIEGMLGTMDERKLTSAEIDELKLIYGDTIDYSEVRVQTGGIKNTLFKNNAQVVGNDIFMPDKYLDGDGFTTEGQDVFMHELGHVWQFQNRGPEYISESIQAQQNEGDGHVGSGEAYDWLAAAENGLSFNDMNTESQAELAMFIGLSILENETEVNRTELQREIRNELKDQTYIVTDEVFTITVEAHNILRGTPQLAAAPAAAPAVAPSAAAAIAEFPEW